MPNIKDVQSSLPVDFILSKAEDKIVVEEKKISCMRTKTEREKQNTANTKPNFQ